MADNYRHFSVGTLTDEIIGPECKARWNYLIIILERIFSTERKSAIKKWYTHLKKKLGAPGPYEGPEPDTEP